MVKKFTGEPQQTLQEIDVEWDRVMETANRDYNAACHGAWQKYLTALKADTRKPGDRTWGKPQEYDKQYDADRQAALTRWELQTNTVGKKLDAARKLSA
jgi:hypothetical protein